MFQNVHEGMAAGIALSISQTALIGRAPLCMTELQKMGHGTEVGTGVGGALVAGEEELNSHEFSYAGSGQIVSAIRHRCLSGRLHF